MANNFDELDKQMDDSSDSIANKEKLYEDMKAMLKNDESDAPVLWRLTKLCLILSVTTDDTKRQKEFAYEAITYGKKACDLDTKCLACHKWYCVALGRVTKFCGISDKVKFGHELKQHLDIGFQINNRDYLLHFISGRFSYEASTLSWIERTFVKTLYGEIPKSSFETALKEFMICDELRPKWKDNYLWIAKTLIAMKDKRKAKEWIDKGLALDVKDKLDELAHNGLVKLKNNNKFD